MATKFITKGRGIGRKVIPLGDKAKMPAKVKVKVDPKLQLLMDIKQRKVITEQELKLVMRRLNDKVYTDTQVLDMISADSMELTPEHSQKGHEYLMDQWKTSEGIERKNNPFGYVEQAILKQFWEIRWAGIFNAGSMNMVYHIPVYEVVCEDGETFKYHMAGGKVNVVR